MSKSAEAKKDFQAWSLTIAPLELTRPWGFEVEAPEGYKITDIPVGLDVTCDGSVDSHNSYAPDCDCDCDDCSHSCDCGRCEYSDYDPDHCGEIGSCNRNYNEFMSVGPVFDSYPDMLVELCENLADTEQNDTAGVHVHVQAKDLTGYEVARVLRVYRNVQWMMSAIAGRSGSRYAIDMDSNDDVNLDIANFEAMKDSLARDTRYYANNRYQAVNTHSLYKHGTIEFRQMACNFNANEIASWGRLHRALLNAVKAGLRPFETESVENLAGYIRVLSRYTIV